MDPNRSMRASWYLQLCNYDRRACLVGLKLHKELERESKVKIKVFRSLHEGGCA